MKTKKDDPCLHARSSDDIDYRVYSNIDAVGKSPSALNSKENRLYSNVDDINISLSGIYLNSPMRKFIFMRYMLDLPVHLRSLARAFVAPAIHWTL